MTTAVLDIRSLDETLADAAETMESGHSEDHALLEAGILTRVPDGRIEFPYDAVKVEFLLSAA